MRQAWVTDPHLNFLRGSVEDFAKGLQEDTNCDGIILTGDISESPTLDQHLKSVESVGVPVHFVLGNHDFYRGSFENTHKIATAHAGYLEQKMIELSTEVCLIGQDGWYDAQYGDPQAPRFGMNDWKDIHDLNTLPGDPFYNHPARKHNVEARRRLIGVCQQRAAEQTKIAEGSLLQALEQYSTVVFATHVPPFDRATWHEGAMSEPKWIPWFSSKVMGEMLLRTMNLHPSKRLIVLCGHTHGSGVYRPNDRITVLTGEAYYHYPCLSGVLDVEGPDVKIVFRNRGAVEHVQM